MMYGDRFFGIEWCWAWGPREDLTHGLIMLRCQCPNCGERASLNWFIPFDVGGGPMSGFDCPVCGEPVRVPVGDQELRTRILDEIGIK
jgi:predicted RNA-binding Zn-ribbon protein involved in translation (DUF1610 family)